MISKTTNLCVSSKVDYCLGSGWYYTDEAGEDEIFNEWAKSVNRKGDSLNKILRKSFDGFFTMGNTFVKVIRMKIGNSRYLKLIKLNMLDVRLLTNDDFDDPTHVAISEDFRREGITSLRKDRYEELPLYTKDKIFRIWGTDSNGDQALVIHIKNEVEGYDHYGLPSNVSGLPHAICEYKDVRYNLDQFENNMVTGGMLILEGMTDQEEANKLARQIVQHHTGDGKRGRVMVLGGYGAEGSKYLPFETQEDGDYIEYDRHTEDKIVSANNWDAMLAGIRRDSGIGNGGNSYIRTIFDIKNQSVIAPAQKMMIEDLIRPVLELCDEWMGTKWTDLPIGIRTVAPVTFAGDIDINSVVTKNEGRSALGLPALEKGGDDFIKTSPVKSAKEGAGNVPA